VRPRVSSFKCNSYIWWTSVFPIYCLTYAPCGKIIHEYFYCWICYSEKLVSKYFKLARGLIVTLEQTALYRNFVYLELAFENLTSHTNRNSNFSIHRSLLQTRPRTRPRTVLTRPRTFKMFLRIGQGQGQGHMKSYLDSLYMTLANFYNLISFWKLPVVAICIANQSCQTWEMKNGLKRLKESMNYWLVR